MRSSKKCSLRVINKTTGKKLYGTAAQLHAISNAGGFDKFMKDYGEEILRAAYDKFSNTEPERKKLRAVK